MTVVKMLYHITIKRGLNKKKKEYIYREKKEKMFKKSSHKILGIDLYLETNYSFILTCLKFFTVVVTFRNVINLNPCTID